MTTEDASVEADSATLPPPTGAAEAPRVGRLQRVLNWLRAGYPEGVPASERTALYGILHRSLSEGEVTEIVAELRREHGVQADDATIAALIREHTVQQASPQEVAMVAARLAAAGWPLESHALDDDHPERTADDPEDNGTVAPSEQSPQG